MLQEQFDVAISFSGKDRNFVKQLKAKLNELGLKVFYDQDFQSTLVGAELTELLESIYRDQCKFCVIVSSENYLATDWGRLEKRSALERALRKDGHVIPVILDDTRIPGIRSTIGYVDARSKSVQEIADVIAAKVLMERAYSDADPTLIKTKDQLPLHLGGPGESLEHPIAQTHLSLIVKRVCISVRTICRNEGLIGKSENLDLGTLLYRKPSKALLECIRRASYSGPSYFLQVCLISGLDVIAHPEIPFGTPIEWVWRGTPLEKFLDQKSQLHGGQLSFSPPIEFFSWVDFVRSRMFESKSVRYSIGLISPCMDAHWSIHKHGIVYVFGEVHLT